MRRRANALLIIMALSTEQQDAVISITGRIDHAVSDAADPDYSIKNYAL